jgi:hypothetical protein
MSKKRSFRPIPTSVRVARWAAIAAAITAIGSVFNTVWVEKPWWKEAPPTPIVRESLERSAPPRAYYRSEAGEGSPVSGARAPASIEVPEAMVMSTASGPEPTLWESFLIKLKTHPVSTWLILGSVLIGAIWIGVEIYEHYKKKKDLSHFIR